MIDSLNKTQRKLYYAFINEEIEFDDIEFLFLFRSLSEDKNYKKLTLEKLQEVINLTHNWFDLNKPI